MHTVTTIGLDIAKSVFQVHGIDATGQVVRRYSLQGVDLRCAGGYSPRARTGGICQNAIRSNECKKRIES